MHRSGIAVRPEFGDDTGGVNRHACAASKGAALPVPSRVHRINDVEKHQQNNHCCEYFSHVNWRCEVATPRLIISAQINGRSHGLFSPLRAMRHHKAEGCGRAYLHQIHRRQRYYSRWILGSQYSTPGQSHRVPIGVDVR